MNLFTEISPITEYHEHKKDRSPDQKEGFSGTSEVCFIICKSCFWCASLLNPKEPYSECPRCHEPNLDFMLIAGGENYRSHQLPTRQVEMEFSG